MTGLTENQAEFLHWARRIAETVDLDTEEYGWKLDLARQLSDARDAVLAESEGWPDVLSRVLGRTTGLLSPFLVMSLRDWLRKDAAAFRAAILPLWSPETPSLAAIDTLTEAFAPLGKKNTPGARKSVASVLLMARDPKQFAPYAVEALRKTARLWGFTEPPASPDSAAYQHALDFFDDFLGVANEHDLSLRDRLDAQGLIWTVAKVDPRDWNSAERTEFLLWRDGGVRLGRRAWLVRGSSVRGVDMIPTWLGDGFVSLSASQLPPLELPPEPEEIRAAVDAGYAQVPYLKREEKVREVRAFLLSMKPDDLVMTTSNGIIHVGTITSDPEQVASDGGRSNLRRAVEWADVAIPFDELPAELSALLKSGGDVTDLTDVVDLVAALFPEDTDGGGGGGATGGETPVELRRLTPEEADALLVGSEWLDELVDLLNLRRQVILYGPPGTGKTYLALKTAEAIAQPENVRMVQFHPAYSYEDFFEGYRPRRGEGGAVGFELKAGPFRRIVEDAREHTDQPYVLIIDEINRANLAKVFGELYFLLEYRDNAIELLNSEEDSKPFSLPKNVYIIGTMNTADRSIALVDAAMRRRFAFLSLHPDDPHVRGMLRTWLQRRSWDTLPADLLDELNSRIPDADFKIGPAYLMKPGEVNSDAGLERIWRTSILPQLEELHYGDTVDVPRRYGLAALRKVIPTAEGEPGRVTSDWNVQLGAFGVPWERGRHDCDRRPRATCRRGGCRARGARADLPDPAREARRRCDRRG